MTYTINRPHRWIIAVYENGKFYGTITNKETSRVKWFRSRENALKWINKKFNNPREGIELIPEIDDENGLTTVKER